MKETMDHQLLNQLQQEWQPLEGTQPKPTRLPLNRIGLVPTVFQCRPSANQRTGTTEDGKGHVASMITELRSSAKADLDAVTVIQVGGRPILVDGHHRFAAYKAAERRDIPVRYYSGSPVDALLMIGRENRKTKLTMSAAERSQWAWQLVQTRRFTKAQEARGSGASDGTVAAMRRVLSTLESEGKPVPERWSDARPKKVHDEDSAAAQSKEWAIGLSQLLGPPKTFSAGKVAMLRDALILWAPRLAEHLTMALAEELDIRAQVDEMVQAQIQEMGDESLDNLIAAKAEAMLVALGKMAPPEF